MKIRQNNLLLHKTANHFSLLSAKSIKKKNFHVLLPLMKYFPEKELYIVGDKDTEYADFIEKTIREENLQNVHSNM